ncbi:unnamed protein product, partial [Ectocarpus sp. 12 AP-2014]
RRRPSRVGGGGEMVFCLRGRPGLSRAAYCGDFALLFHEEEKSEVPLPRCCYYLRWFLLSLGVGGTGTATESACAMFAMPCLHQQRKISFLVYRFASVWPFSRSGHAGIPRAASVSLFLSRTEVNNSTSSHSPQDYFQAMMSGKQSISSSCLFRARRSPQS